MFVWAFGLSAVSAVRLTSIVLWHFVQRTQRFSGCGSLLSRSIGCGSSPAMRVFASPTISLRAVRVHSEQSKSPVMYFERRRVRARGVLVAVFAALRGAAASVAIK